MNEQAASSSRGQVGKAMEQPVPHDGSSWHTWVWVAFSSVVYLVVIAAWSAVAVGLEAAEPGLAQVWMWGMAILWVPILWIASEILGNPVLNALEELSWWKTASSVVRVSLGVAGALPFFAFMVWTTWLFRRWFGVPGW